MYFNNFEKIFYDFKLTDDTSKENKLFIIRDITKNVRVRKQVLENITIYDEYDIAEGETPELIAEKFYGDPQLHWIIMLVNQRYDYLKDFPMSSLELDEYVDDTYGENKYKAHHYKYNDLLSDGRGSLKLPDNILENVKIHDIVGNENLKSMIESIDLNNKLVNLRIFEGSFTVGEPVNIFGYRYIAENINNYVYSYIGDFVLPSNSFNLFFGYREVSNWQHEFEVNESKRRIKMISKDFVDQIVSEFENIL